MDDGQSHKGGVTPCKGERGRGHTVQMGAASLGGRETLEGTAHGDDRREL